jgi:hypothetical protein
MRPEAPAAAGERAAACSGTAGRQGGGRPAAAGRIRGWARPAGAVVGGGTVAGGRRPLAAGRPHWKQQQQQRRPLAGRAAGAVIGPGGPAAAPPSRGSGWSQAGLGQAQHSRVHWEAALCVCRRGGAGKTPASCSACRSSACRSSACRSRQVWRCRRQAQQLGGRRGPAAGGGRDWRQQWRRWSSQAGGRRQEPAGHDARRAVQLAPGIAASWVRQLSPVLLEVAWGLGLCLDSRVGRLQQPLINLQADGPCEQSESMYDTVASYYCKPPPNTVKQYKLHDKYTLYTKEFVPYLATPRSLVYTVMLAHPPPCPR